MGTLRFGSFSLGLIGRFRLVARAWICSLGLVCMETVAWELAHVGTFAWRGNDGDG